MIKLIAIDLDGTLLTDQKTISAKNKATLQKAKAAGVKIVICTGRPLKAIETYLTELNLRQAGDYSITFNGGLVQKNDTGEILAKTVMNFDQVQEIAQLLKDLALPMDILSDSIAYQIDTAPAHLSIYPQLNKALTYKKQALKDLGPDLLYNKIVSAIDAEYLDQQIAKIPRAFYDRYEIVKTRANLLEFMPKGVTKAYGLQLLGKELAIAPADMMALGDEANDLPMIQAAGLGVAMANAVAEVKQHADVTTLSNEADGVAVAIEKYVLK